MNTELVREMIAAIVDIAKEKNCGKLELMQACRCLYDATKAQIKSDLVEFAAERELEAKRF